MNNIRAKFIRGEEVKFISHLDLMKVFERASRRGSIPIAYSQGFNPHPQMIFGLPLSVGVTSDAEYVDFELAREIKLEEFTAVLNSQLPRGIKIIDAKYHNTHANIMKSIGYASYNVLVSSDEKKGINKINNYIKELMERKQLSMQKESKKGTREIDIRPMIITLDMLEANSENLSMAGENEVSCLKMLLRAGSVSNLKPELLISALNEIGDINLKIVKIHRTGLFIDKEGIVLDPLDDRALSET